MAWMTALWLGVSGRILPLRGRSGGGLRSRTGRERLLASACAGDNTDPIRHTPAISGRTRPGLENIPFLPILFERRAQLVGGSRIRGCAKHFRFVERVSAREWVRRWHPLVVGTYEQHATRKYGLSIGFCCRLVTTLVYPRT